MFPQIGYGYADPYLCTYYAFTALLVVSLTIRLLWNPSVQLITELNTVITRTVIYFNTEILGYSNAAFFTSLEAAFLSERTLLSLTVFCTSFVLYLASSDIIRSAMSYMAALPIHEVLNNMMNFGLNLIKDLPNLVDNKKVAKSKSKMSGRHNGR